MEKKILASPSTRKLWQFLHYASQTNRSWKFLLIHSFKQPSRMEPKLHNKTKYRQLCKNQLLGVCYLSKMLEIIISIQIDMKQSTSKWSSILSSKPIATQLLDVDEVEKESKWTTTSQKYLPIRNTKSYPSESVLMILPQP